MLKIRQISALADNYIYIITDLETQLSACIDPALSEPIFKLVEKENINLKYIFNTHHHFDHVGGNEELKEKIGCKVVGNKKDKDRIPGIDIFLENNQSFSLGNSKCLIFEVPGHTVGHICFYFNKDNVLFCGDTLFSLGCGRLFEGTPSQMTESLLKIRSLPDETKIYCGHEYTQSNAAFAQKLDPNDSLLQKKIDEVEKKRNKSQPTIPSILGDEKKLNPFLKFDDIEFLKKIGLKNSTNDENFKTLRIMKDNF